ncbi:MAG: glycosyltransferase family 4 protein [Chromatiaceae bacterium]|nr:glycosyltransferase family 4 protein [Chromatiaceae bacterium]
MRAHTAISDVHAFANLRWIDPGSEEKASPPPHRHQASSWRRLITATPGYVSLRGKFHALRFKRKLSRLTGPIVYHEPNFVLRPFDGPTLATVHDLGWIHYPDFIAPPTRRWLEKGMPDSLQQASLVIAVSEYVARERKEILGIPTERIRVTALGLDRRFAPCPPGKLVRQLVPLGLTPGRYVLSVATLEPRKNLTRLTRAFSRLPMRLQRRFPLVLAGAAGWEKTPRATELERLQRKGVLKRLGYVDEAILPSLFAGASCLALPSLYEGFGLPFVEAMASGIPVLTSDCAAMAEVAGAAALLVDPQDDHAIAVGLERLLTNRGFCNELVHLGLKRSRRFRWQRTVELTLDAYRDTVAS